MSEENKEAKMPSQTQLLTINDLISETELVKKACSVFNFTAKLNHHNRWMTANIAEYKLDTDLINALRPAGFTFEQGKDQSSDMVYLAGHSYQTNIGTFYSDSWAWNKSEKNPFITVGFYMSASGEKRGIEAIPHVWGNCSGGASHQPTINKLVRAIANFFSDCHQIIKRMNETDDYPVIQWNELSLGGLQSLSTLFKEKYGNNKIVYQNLAESNFSPFNPDPRSISRKENHFVPESIQHKLMKQWEKQLQEFKNSLV
jgi:hypothetical protein